MTDAVAVPRTFWVVAVVLLLWNLIGVAAFAAQYTADLTELAKTDPVTAREFAAMPGWAWAAYAIATVAGTIASIALLVRRKIATALFVVSLVAIVMQFGRSLLMTDLIADKGASVVIFPMVVFAIGGFQIWWSRTCASRGCLR